MNDGEPSLGSVERVSQKRWSEGNRGPWGELLDYEDEHDGREDSYDREFDPAVEGELEGAEWSNPMQPTDAEKAAEIG